MFNGRIFIYGIIVLNFLVEEGICTEDAECNLRGDIEILILFESLKVNGFTFRKKALFRFYFGFFRNGLQLCEE